MNNRHVIAGVAFTLLCFAVLLRAANGQVRSASGELTTLYSIDALSHTLCFADGGYGMVVQDGEVKNRCSDIDFDTYNPGSFTSGIEGARVAALVDLGTEADLSAKHKFEETVGGGQGFASIQLKDRNLYILKNRKERTLQVLSNVDTLLGNLRPGASALVRTGHIYLLRIADQHEPSRELFVKLLVVSYRLGESVTIRWQLL